MIELNKGYNMDCLEGMKMIPDKSIDMILCDLPYKVTSLKWDEIIPFNLLWEQYNRISKINAAIVLTSSQPFTTDLINSNRAMFKYSLIWEKNKFTNFMQAKRQPMRNHEDVVVFYKSQPTYNPQRRPVQTRGYGDDKGRKNLIYNISGKASETYKKVRQEDGLGYPGSLIKINVDNHSRSLHPTQKPVALFEYLIKTYTNEGETVMDNCAGSFTTAVACENTNRNWLCFEWCPNEPHDKYFNIGMERIKKRRAEIGKEKRIAKSQVLFE